MELKVKKVREGARFPSQPYEGDAGYDLFAVEEACVPAHGRVTIPTGLAIELPEGYAGLIWDKSGLATKGGLTVLGGVIDAGYRGEVLVCLANTSAEQHVFTAGDKVAQLLVQKVELPTIVEVDELAASDRGERGFGSSGKA